MDKEIKQEIKQEEAEKKKTAALVLKKLFAGDDTIYDSMKDQQDEEDEQYPEKLYPPPRPPPKPPLPGDVQYQISCPVAFRNDVDRRENEKKKIHNHVPGHTYELLNEEFPKARLDDMVGQ